MATLRSTITIDSSDFFSTKLNVSTSNSTVTTGDDRAFSVERVSVGTRAYSTITQTADSLSWMNNKTMLFTDAQKNQHTITFSTAYSNSNEGNVATGSINVNGGTIAVYNTLTLILVDNYSASAARTLTITFNHTTTEIVRGSSTKTGIAYAVGLSGLADEEAIRNKIVTALTTIRTAGDISITAVASVSNVELITLTQDVLGYVGNTTISGTATSQLTLTSFTTGGDAYTSTYAGISNNAATTTAHLLSLRSSLMLAISEGRLNMGGLTVPTTDTMDVYMIGPYVADSGITITGTAITTAATTAATVFAGARVPDVLPVGEFSSKYEQVYLYVSNKSAAGSVDFYIKESTTKASGTITASIADTTDLNVGGTLSLISPKNNTYVITIVAVGAETANTRTGDLTADVEDSAASDVFMTNLIETISLLDNEVGNEARPFSATVDGAGLVLTIEPTDIDSGITGNTTITQNYSGGALTVSDVDFAGGLDTFHHIMRLDPGAHLFVPLSGNPRLYCDSEGVVSEIEYLTLEK